MTKARIVSLLFVSLVFAATGCKKKTDAPPPEPDAAAVIETPPTTPPPAEDAAPPAVEDAAPAKTGDAPTVRPPTVNDLATYTKDIPGDGPLMATINTSMGAFHCELLDKVAPMTVANFIGLSRGLVPWMNPNTHEVETKPLYSGTIFHRVIPDFMIQGGDPMGIGMGGPGYQFGDETKPELAKHDRGGVLSMANAGPGTNGSQFFITDSPKPHLDGRHTVFGYCAEVDLVKKIEAVPRSPDDKPTTDIVIQKIEITRGAGKAAPKGGDGKDSKPAGKPTKSG